MFDGHDWMWGMHVGWWIFWVAIGVLAIALLARGGSLRSRPAPAESPLEILERRYAAGELTTEEYEERRARLSGVAQ